jgi:hypothetical protein
MSILNLVLTDPTYVQASFNKGKKVVEISSSIVNSEESIDEKTMSSIQKDETKGQGEENSNGLPLSNFVAKKVSKKRRS